MKNRNTFKFLFATVLIGGSFAASAMEADTKKTAPVKPYSDFELEWYVIERFNEVSPLLPDGVEVNGPYHNDIGLLVAATLGEVPRIELYLAQGANINFQDKLGRTPLMLAALKKKADAVDLLIKSKANLEIKKLDGATALMCSTNNLPCLHLLIKAGANINALDNKGHNAFSRKMHHGVSHLKKIGTCLIEAGSDILPAIKTRDSETANAFEITPFIGEFLRFNRTQREKVPALLWCLKNTLQNDNKIDPMLCLVLAEYLFDAQTDANEQTIRDGINNMKTEMWKQLLLETLNKESN